MKHLFLFLLALCMGPAFAQSGTSQAQATLMVRIVIPPIMEVKSVKQTPEGVEYSGYTNMREATLGGQYVTFAKPGPFTVLVRNAQTQTQQVESTTFVTITHY